MPKAAVFLGLAVLATSFVAPAGAQTVPQEAERYLWCGSAFRLMGAVARTPEEAENAAAASELLTVRAAELLFAAGVSEEQGRQILAAYDEKVLADIESGDIAFNGDACAAALEEQP